MKTIIISDLHNRVNWIEPVLTSPIINHYDRVIFLGDYFDEFNDTPKDVYDSAIWLKQSLHKPNRIHLWGTHDLWYRFPNNYFTMASGNSEEKEEVINNILTIDDWNLIRPYYYEQNFLMTHAGVHQFLIAQYINQNRQDFDKYISNNKIRMNSQEIVDQIIKPATEKALKDVNNNIVNPWFEAGFARWGRQKVGGITWLDWREEFAPVPVLNQIVGHTTVELPEKRVTNNSKNYCMDTRNRHICILENGKITFIDISDVL